MGYGNHLAHQFYLPFCHTVIEPSTIAEDGVDEDRRALSTLFLAVAGHKLGLFLTEHQTRADGIKREAELLPYGQCATDILGRVLDVELPVVEGVRHEGCGQTVSGNAKVGEDGQHGTHAYFTVAYHIIDQ